MADSTTEPSLLQRIRFSLRISGIVVTDVVASYLIMLFVIHRYGHMSYENPLLWVYALSFIPLAIATHYAFGVNTELNRKLGLAPRLHSP